MRKLLNEFFAVTHTSVYHIQALGPWVASAKKIALKGKSKILVGEDIAKGGMIAIGFYLLAYIPEKYGTGHMSTGYERDPKRINTRYWRDSSSNIVGLFKDKDAAMICHNSNDQRECDWRWIDSTRDVLAGIGDRHPSFFVFKDRDFGLIQPKTA